MRIRSQKGKNPKLFPIFVPTIYKKVQDELRIRKVAAAVPHVKVADCKFNVERIESQIAIAEGKGVQIIVFPEMSITGYTCGDLFGQQILLEEAEMGLMQILNNTRQLDIISIVGMPVVVNSTVINAAVVIQKEKY